MKIGLVIYGSLDTVSGGYYYDRRLVRSLQEAGHPVCILSLPWRNYAAALADNQRFRLPPGLDLVIQDELCHASLLAANRRPHPCPVISLVHHLRCSEDHPPALKALYRSIERLYLRSVDGFIFNSNTTRATVQALCGRSKPFVMAYPPGDRFPCRLSSEQVARRARQGGPLRILFVGNLLPRKGLHTLLAAAARLPRHSFRLDVVGSHEFDRAYARKARQQAAALGEASAVRFHGVLENENLQERLQDADILAVPSSYEGFGIVYPEGMAFGLPAIGTTGGAAGEVIRHGENGYLIAPGDTAALHAHLSALQADRDLLARLSVQAVESYREMPPWAQGAGAIVDFLAGMVG